MVTVARSTCWGCDGHSEVSGLESGGLTGPALLTRNIWYHLVPLAILCEPSLKPRMFLCGDSGQKYMLGCNGHTGVSGLVSGGLTGAVLLTHSILYHLVPLTTLYELGLKPRMYVCSDSGQKYMFGV